MKMITLAQPANSTISFFVGIRIVSLLSRPSGECLYTWGGRRTQKEKTAGYRGRHPYPALFCKEGGKDGVGLTVHCVIDYGNIASH